MLLAPWGESRQALIGVNENDLERARFEKNIAGNRTAEKLTKAQSGWFYESGLYRSQHRFEAYFLVDPLGCDIDRAMVIVAQQKFQLLKT